MNITRIEDCWRIQQLACVPAMQDAPTVAYEDSESRELIQRQGNPANEAKQKTNRRD